MKKTILFLLCSINLFAYKVENVEDKKIIIYPSKVVVNESLKLKDDGNKNKIIYEGVSQNIDINSINLIGGELKEIEFEKNEDSNSILKSYIGKNIKAEKNGKTYDLILLDYRQNIVGKDVKTGEIHILNNPDLKLEDKDIKMGNKLIMEIGKIDEKLNLSYITFGLSLDISHKLDINKMNLETWGKIYNNTGVDLEDVEIRIISELRAPRNYMMKSTMMDSAVSMEGASIVESNDRIEYKLNDRYNLKKNSEKNIKLETRKVELVEKYVYNTRSYSKNPTRVIEIKNLQDTPISMGRIYIWDGDDIIGDSSIGFIPEGEKYNLQLNKNFNLIINRKVIKTKDLGSNLIKKEVEIKIKNNNDDKIKLEINYDELPQIWSELKSQEKYKKISNRVIRFNLELDEKSEKVINFSFVEEKK